MKHVGGPVRTNCMVGTLIPTPQSFTLHANRILLPSV